MQLQTSEHGAIRIKEQSFKPFSELLDDSAGFKTTRNIQ